MRLDSIQIGKSEPSAAAVVGTSGINKTDVERAIVSIDGLVGDEVADTKRHGGPGQAVYIYTREDYAYWESELGRSFSGGAFGENLTVSGFSSADLWIGDRFVFPSGVILEASAARIPCGVFAERIAEPAWVERFKRARRPGVYCRVIEGGELEAGTNIDPVPVEGDSILVLETFDLSYDRSASAERLTAALATPVAERNRDGYVERLSKMS